MVIVDTGIILTNLHVVHGAKRIKVVFHDGLESDALVIGTQPEHDLAVLQAKIDSRRPVRGDAALDRRACARASRWWRWASRSASGRRSRRA